MKKLHLYLPAIFLFMGYFSFAQVSKNTEQADSTGLPGDHFNLQGALSLFKQSSNPEDFEKKLNSENTYVNNLDLNADGKTDYILITDKSDGNSHAVVLQVAVSETETQDIAVIEIEKTGNETADLQILGDEELYGVKKIIEPFEESESIDKKGPSAPSLNIVVVNVWFWPCVKFIYAPVYKPWVSPWRWHHYPAWWKPWNPHPWRWHHSHCKPYFAHFRVASKHRVVTAHKVYVPHRRTSAIVINKHKVAVNKYRNGNKINKVNHNRVPVKATNIKNQKATYGPRNKGHNTGGKGGNKSNAGGHRK